MNEQFQEYLMGIIEKTGDFLSTEIPEVAEQILLYNLSIAIMGSLFGLILSIGGYSNIYSYHKIEGTTTDYQDWKCGMFGYVLGLISLIVFVAHGTTALKIWLAPKLYLLEYAADLVK